MNKEKIFIFDTTLRDGAQTEGVDFSLEDKKKIAKLLSEIGVDYIEGGWPGANPVDTEFFSKPLASTTSKKFLLISTAILLLILKLHATTPPKALRGSQAKAFLNDLIGILFFDTPHGFACFIITVPASFPKASKISREANISL